MNLIQRLMGRRQFLMAAGAASACMLSCRKLAGFHSRGAMAAEKAAAAHLKASGNRCPHLLSPLRIRNRMLKNRIMHTVSPNYLMQGPENYPTDAWRKHYANMARNAAIVSVNTCFGEYPKDYSAYNDVGWSRISNDKWEDIPPVQNYVDRMIEDIHCEGSLAMFVGNTGGGGMPGMPGMSDGAPGGGEGGRGGMPGESAPGGGEGGQGSMPMMGGGPMGRPSMSVEEIVADAKEAAGKGYDVYKMDSPSLEAAEAIRNQTDLLIMASLRIGGGMGGGGGKNSPGISNVNQPSEENVAQAVEAVRELEGVADFVWIRDGRHEHPNSWIQDRDKPFNLAYAEAVKKAGLKILTCPSAGFHDPVQNDAFIADGKTDMVGMTTPFFADPEFVRKLSAGRADDILPCLQCHDCHGISLATGPYYATCSVNPEWVAPVYKLSGIQTPLEKKKVAVIGGGPGGMKAALVAAERGHDVTLFEKDSVLGGLLQFSDHSRWRWNHREFKDYLARQVDKAGIKVKLNTTATREMIAGGGFDTVLVATGAAPVVPRMPGADAGNVFDILTCYSSKKDLGKNVVVIGAGKIGTEAAIGMAMDGHKVTVLATGKQMVQPEYVGAHNMSNQEGIYRNHPDFSYVLETTVKSITGGKVVYTDAKGADHSINADSIVIYAGLKPRMDEAETFIGAADEVLLVGHCTGQNPTIQKTIRSAFFVASQV
jgi:2,4-dienoyl-CoA reductase-like NADH-dependent reductase (Old Yellow Enzyme family)/thioredoxin reductase